MFDFICFVNLEYVLLYIYICIFIYMLKYVMYLNVMFYILYIYICVYVYRLLSYMFFHNYTYFLFLRVCKAVMHTCTLGRSCIATLLHGHLLRVESVKQFTYFMFTNCRYGTGLQIVKTSQS